MKEKDRAFWVVLIVSLALIAFLLSYAALLKRQHPPAALEGSGGIATPIYVEHDGPTGMDVFTIADGRHATSSSTGLIISAKDAGKILMSFPDRNYAFIYANGERNIVQVPHPGTDGQECLASLRACKSGPYVGCMLDGTWCDSPRYVDVFTEDGKRIRVDRASGETIR